jgi:hypothetical protein
MDRVSPSVLVVLVTHILPDPGGPIRFFIHGDCDFARGFFVLKAELQSIID